MDQMFENLQEGFVDYIIEVSTEAEREAPDFLDRATSAGLDFANRYIDQIKGHWIISAFVKEVVSADIELGFFDPRTLAWGS